MSGDMLVQWYNVLNGIRIYSSQHIKLNGCWCVDHNHSIDLHHSNVIVIPSILHINDIIMHLISRLPNISERSKLSGIGCTYILIGLHLNLVPPNEVRHVANKTCGFVISYSFYNKTRSTHLRYKCTLPICWYVLIK